MGVKVQRRAQATLLRAVDLLQRAGWTQHEDQSEEGQFCAVGAIENEEYNRESGELAKRALYAVLPKEYHEHEDTDPWFQITRWNDRPSRRKADVIRKMRQAAKSLDVTVKNRRKK